MTEMSYKIGISIRIVFNITAHVPHLYREHAARRKFNSPVERL